jgi:hypothetical protein
MKKSEAFDSSLKKTFDECCEGEGWEIEFENFIDDEKNHECCYECEGNLFKDNLKSFISSLLAKQQEEFVKILESKKDGEKCPKGWGCDYCGGCVDLYDEALDDVLADIKSKLNKEEPAYIGGVNLTTNDDTEISNRLAVTDKNIDQLRQWLNEDKIDDFKKMITNDDIKFWLDIK